MKSAVSLDSLGRPSATTSPPTPSQSFCRSGGEGHVADRLADARCRESRERLVECADRLRTREYDEVLAAACAGHLPAISAGQRHARICRQRVGRRGSGKREHQKRLPDIWFVDDVEIGAPAGHVGKHQLVASPQAIAVGEALLAGTRHAHKGAFDVIEGLRGRGQRTQQTVDSSVARRPGTPHHPQVGCDDHDQRRGEQCHAPPGGAARHGMLDARCQRAFESTRTRVTVRGIGGDGALDHLDERSRQKSSSASRSSRRSPRRWCPAISSIVRPATGNWALMATGSGAASVTTGARPLSRLTLRQQRTLIKILEVLVDESSTCATT